MSSPLPFKNTSACCFCGLSCLTDRRVILPRDPLTFVSPVTMRVTGQRPASRAVEGCTRQKIRIHRHINISHSYNTGKQTQHVSHETDKQVKLQPPGQPIRSDSEISPQCSPQVHYFSRTCQLWLVILICLRPLPCLLTLAGDLLLCECDTAVLEIFNKTLNILDVTFCTCCRWSLSFGMVWRLCLDFQDGWSQKVKQRRTSVFISQIWNRMLKPNHFKVLNHHIYPDDRAHMTKVLPGSSCFVWTTSNDVILIDIAAKTGK